MKYMPPTKSDRWITWMLIYAILLWLPFILHRFVLLGQTFSLTISLRFALLALVMSGIVNGLGWLGVRLVWLITTIGIVIGLGLMFIYSNRDMSGWADLAAFLTFYLCTLGGFTLGLLTEGMYWLIRKLHKS
ncbi:hypothetical protein [Paenibacillus sp. FSL K6-2524]|uniref:hypothetical protein n=1 Tax=Paenibacillus sp. FSL K6-2524 TaxID=2954516 RepID=UPI0030F7FDAE